MNSWDVNDTDELAATLSALESVQSKFNAKARGGKQISMADMIVLGGAAAIESAGEAWSQPRDSVCARSYGCIAS